MGTNSIGQEEEGQHSINIWQVNEDRLASMHQKLSEPPKLLSKSAGHSNCCIFRVPESLIDSTGRTYQPHIVSIGPYHHGQPHLKMIEEHKWRFLGLLLNRTQMVGLGLKDLLKAVQPLEMMARECYAEIIHFGTDEFIEMLVLDGCFIIELFRKIGGVIQVEQDDPLTSMSWVYSFFLRDLIRLENQIPFFILECLFNLTTIQTDEEDSAPSFSALVLQFFNNAIQRPEDDDYIAKYSNLRGKHLLDFLRSSFLPSDFNEPVKPDTNPPSHVIHCISKLRRAGIRLQPKQSAQTFLTIKFRHGVIHMPTVTIDDFMITFLQNCVAYEQCHSDCSTHMTTYATLLDCLINTSKDVEYLCDKNIIENYFGTDAEVARFINDLGKDISFDINSCYLAGLFDEVNTHYKSSWHVTWASFKYTYFDTPWSFISALAALVLLLLTVAQTFYTIMGYIRPPN